MYKPKFINTDLLTYRCEQDIISFVNDPTVAGEVKYTPDGIYIHRKNGNNVLAVAHLDTVQQQFQVSIDGELFKNPQLDDRLGVYLLLDVLPEFGCEYDILLTVGEEIGKSTAAHFDDRDYGWMFEIDRMFDKSVMYMYHTKIMEDYLTSFGFQVAHGSKTDISYLEHLGIWGVNFACHYGNNHGLDAFVNMRLLDETIPKIAKFVRANRTNVFPHRPKKIDNTKYQSNISKEVARDYRKDNQVVLYNNPGGNLTWGRYVYDSVVGEFVCMYCDRLQSECSGNTCDFAGCIICGFDDCVIEKCSLCELHLHNSRYLAHFGLCKDCLRQIIQNDVLIEKFESVMVTDIEYAIENIMETIGQKWITR